MENQQQNKKNVLMPILVIVGSIIVAYFMSGVGPVPQTYNIDPNLLKKIDSLERANSILQTEKAQLDSILEDYEIRTGDLDWKLSKLMKEREEDQNKHHQIAEEARTEDEQQTENFFKDRYNF